jgi:hypothetical protein
VEAASAGLPVLVSDCHRVSPVNLLACEIALCEADGPPTPDVQRRDDFKRDETAYL